MRSVYRVFAFLVAAGVLVQAAAIAYGVFAMGKYIDGGGTVDKSSESFPGSVGLMVHGIGGMMVIPIIALLFLVLSFFAKVPGGVKWALIVLVTTLVQVALGVLANSVPILGALHGIVALLLFGLAVSAAMRVKSGARVGAPTPARVG